MASQPEKLCNDTRCWQKKVHTLLGNIKQNNDSRTIDILKLNIQLSQDSNNKLLSIHPSRKKLISIRNLYSMFTTALLLVVKPKKQQQTIFHT